MFKAGKLNSSEIINQLPYVVTMLALVDMEACGINLDVDGNNAKLVRYFLNDKERNIHGWVHYVGFENYSFEGRTIYIWF